MTTEYAFPHENSHTYQMTGMTLRDYFAAKAMQGIVSDPNVTVGWEKTAAWAYSMADAMMEARK
jgi:hypothetical protein